jgi:hypothetical protein
MGSNKDASGLVLDDKSIYIWGENGGGAAAVVTATARA